MPKRKNIYNNNRAHRIRGYEKQADIWQLEIGKHERKLREYDFDVEYLPGTKLTDADAFSRIYEAPPDLTDYDIRHKSLVEGSDNINYWKPEDRNIRIMPKLNEGIQIINECHEKDIAHRGRDAILYELRKTHYWPNMDTTATAYIKTCEACTLNYQKTNGGDTFVTSTNPTEITAADIMLVDQQTSILTFIDYYTRLARVVEINS